MKWLYNEITETVEDHDEFILVDVPDSIDQEDREAVRRYIKYDADNLNDRQGIVSDRDVVESLRLILDAEDLPIKQVLHIIDSLTDAMTNNYGA
jgi:hypothetical protein